MIGQASAITHVFNCNTFNVIDTRVRMLHTTHKGTLNYRSSTIKVTKSF